MATFLSETQAGNTQLYKAKESFPEFTSDNILEFPWNIWRDLEKSDSFFRKNLSNILYYTLQLRYFRNYIHEEVSKNRSRKGNAVKRAYRYSKNDAKKAIGSLPTLNLEQLWKIVDNRSTTGSKSLKDRLDAVLSKNFFNILKNETNKVLLSQENHDSDSDLDQGSEIDVSEVSTSHKVPEPLENLEKEDSDYSKKNFNDVDDQFFKLEEMEAFADKDFDEEGEIDYFDSLGEESDDSVAAADMKFSDFFKDPDLADDESVEDLKPLTCGDDLEGMDEYDQEMELMLQKLENEVVDDEEDDELYRDEIEDDFGSEENEEDQDFTGEPLDFDSVDESSSKFDDTVDQQDSEISRIENELVAPKHWSLMGESTAKNRPRNSLLDLELELPQTSSVVYETQDLENQENQQNHEPLPIEVIITQRIKTGVFDNVERKLFLEDQLEAAENLKKHKTDDKMNEIDFNKNEMGLGEVYAQKYKEQFMAIDKLDSHKKELSEQFAKLVYKLDSLSNCSFVPKRVSESEKATNVPIISVETPVNVVLSQPPKEVEVLKPNKVSRNAKKRKFNNKMKGLVKSGRLTTQDVEKIKEKMKNKNKKNRENAKSRKETGLTAKEAMRQDMKPGRRLNTTELLCNIANV